MESKLLFFPLPAEQNMSDDDLKLVTKFEEVAKEEKEMLNEKIEKSQKDLKELAGARKEMQKELKELAGEVRDKLAGARMPNAETKRRLDDLEREQRKQKRPKSSDTFALTRSEIAQKLTNLGSYSNSIITPYSDDTWQDGWTKLKQSCNQADDEAGLQRAFGELVSGNKSLQLAWHDTHNSSCLKNPKRELDSQSPDLSCTLKGKAAETHTLIAIIELKAPGVSINTDETKGELLDKLSRIAHFQGQRRVVFGMLFNGCESLVMRCEFGERDEGMTKYEYRDTDEGDNAWRVVRGFMESSSANLGMCEPVTIGGTQYTAGPWRGQGATCNVYSLADNSGVLKVYGDEDRQKQEAAFLNQLAELLKERIPKVIASEGKYLVVKPFARHFCATTDQRTFYFEDAQHLMKTLQTAHQNGYVHRDVTPNNFFTTTQPGVLLNDWGSAVKVKGEVQHEGAPGDYKAPWITDGHIPEPRDDLYSFIVSCLYLSGCKMCLFKQHPAYSAGVEVLSSNNTELHKEVLTIVGRILLKRS